MPNFRALSLSLVALVAITACNEKKAEAPAPASTEQQPVHAATPVAADAGATAAAPAADPNVVTLLVTADENGFLLPVDGEGGAAEMLGKWKTDEKHCVGADCAKAQTIALTTGDHWGGPSISSFFMGESTAEALKQMGYAASGFGNHELDFSREQFLKNKEQGGFPYVAANLAVKPGSDQDAMKMPPYVILERNGHKVAVVGLANVNAAKTTMSGRFEGLELSSYEDALGTAVPAAWKEGADAVVVLVDECPSELQATVEKHTDWKLAAVFGGHCSQPFEKKVKDTWLASPGRHFQSYAKADLKFDPKKPTGERLTKVDGKVVKVAGAKPDAGLASTLAQWKEKNDKSLGEEIGFTKTGLAEGSPELSRWITRALRASFNTDVALVNKKGIREGLAAGKITRGSVYTVIPFENSVLVVHLKGEDLKKALDNESALYAGVNKGPKGYTDMKGKAIDPAKTYTVATVEYLYFGGDGFEFEKQDENPTETGRVWQTPVIEWTKTQKSSEGRPLERMLR